MRYFPIFLDLQDAVCLVVGAGQVGLRKTALLLEYALAGLELLDPVRPAVLPADQRLIYKQRAFEPQDLQGKTLVFAATSDPLLNAEIAELCAQQNILCNNASGLGAFLTPASVRQGPVQIAVSTLGGSPAFSAFLKSELATWLNSGYASLGRLLTALRPVVLNLDLSSSDKTALLRQLCAKEQIALLREHLAAEDSEALLQTLRKILPQDCHSLLPELLHTLTPSTIDNNAQQ